MDLARGRQHHLLPPLPRLSVSPSQIDFGDVVVGESSQPAAITIFNRESHAVTLASLYVVPFNQGFTSSNTCGQELAPDASCAVSIVFTPRNGGVARGKLRLRLGTAFDVMANLQGKGVVRP